MRKLILLAGIAALTAAVPATANAQGRGHGRGHAAHSQGHGNSAAAQQRRVDAQQRRTTTTRVVDRNGDGVDAQQRRTTTTRVVDRNGDGVDDRTGRRYGGAVCPPGLANRTPACVPPGQARRGFREGQLVPQNYGNYTTYDQLIGRVPEAYRTQIPTGYNYIYNGNNVYVVDPRTRIVQDVINLLR